MSMLHIAPEAIWHGPLMLVNARHPMREPAEERMVALGSGGFSVPLNARAAALLTELLTEIGAGNGIVPVSGFRSRAEQERIYRESLRDNGPAFTRRFVALPGCSEHETGLAIDLGERRASIDFIRPAFPDTGLCGAFRRRAAQYGFILRYPMDKQDVTGIDHEPWHFRYVGAPHAEIMERENLCLEEYVSALRSAASFSLQERGVEIRFIRPGGEDVEIPDDAVAQVSGNNVDGCIVTLWRHRK